VIKLLYLIVLIADTVALFGCVGTVQANCANFSQFCCCKSLGHEELARPSTEFVRAESFDHSVRRRRETCPFLIPKGFLDWKDAKRNMPRAEGIEPSWPCGLRIRCVCQLYVDNKDLFYYSFGGV
jgi:hypothetical protein